MLRTWRILFSADKRLWLFSFVQQGRSQDSALDRSITKPGAGLQNIREVVTNLDGKLCGSPQQLRKNSNNIQHIPQVIRLIKSRLLAEAECLNTDDSL